MTKETLKMNRYYFYSVENREENKRNKEICFSLYALYDEQVHSGEEAGAITNFHFFDRVTCIVKTDVQGSYYFTFEHAPKLPHILDVETYSELKEHLLWKGGYKPIDESFYMRLRQRAVRLMFRHSEFFNPTTENDLFFYSRNPGDFCNIQIARVTRKPDEENLLVSTEEIEIFMPEPGESGEMEQHSKFYINSNPAGVSTPGIGVHKFSSIKEVEKLLFFLYRGICKSVNIDDYKEFRNFCRFKIWDHYELNVSELLNA